MKRHLPCLAAALLLGLVGCSASSDEATPEPTPPTADTEAPTTDGSSVEEATSPDEDTGPPPTGPFTVTVEGGYGGGTYEPGDEVDVFAANDPFEEIVTSWQAEGLGETPPAEWHLSFSMPARDVTLTPTLAAVALDWQEKTIQGVESEKRVFFHAPAGAPPTALLFLFHGTGGSAELAFKPSAFHLALVATHLGMAVVSPEAQEVTLGDPGSDGKLRWNAVPDLGTNVDLQDIELVSDRLTELGLVPAEVPRYALGMSNGGSFALTVGAALPFTAVASYCATGRPDVHQSTTTPSMWLMCMHDNNETLAAKKDQWPFGSDALALREIPTGYHVHPPSPLYPGRFARLQGVDVTASEAAVAELAAAGFLDDRGHLLMTAGELTTAVAASLADFPATGVVEQAGGKELVQGELKAAYADHQLYSDWARLMFAFFEANTP